MVQLTDPGAQRRPVPTAPALPLRVVLHLAAIGAGAAPVLLAGGAGSVRASVVLVAVLVGWEVLLRVADLPSPVRLLVVVGGPGAAILVGGPGVLRSAVLVAFL